MGRRPDPGSRRRGTGPAAPYAPRVHPLPRRVLDRSPERLRPPLRVVIGTVGGALEDRLPGLAAELAFWVLLSLPALLLTAVAGLSVVAGEGNGWQDQLVERIVEVASVALTSQAIENALRPILTRLLDGTTVPLVSLAFLTAIWTASRAVKVILVTIAITYGAPTPRGIGHRVLGFVLTVVGLIIGIVLAPLLIAGPNFAEQLADFGVVGAETLAATYRAAYWPTAVLVVTAAVAALYHLGAPWSTRWRRDLPGAILATALWIAGSGALRLYGTWILDSDSVYGPLAGPIVGLLWLWLTGFAVLLGAELNAQIEREWPTRDSEDDGDAGRLRRLIDDVTDRFTPDRAAAAQQPDGS